MPRGWKVVAVLAAALLSGGASVPDVVTLPFVSHFSDSQAGGALPKGWEPWTLSPLKKPTQYQLVTEDGKTVIKASAHASASGLIHPLSVDPGQYPLLHWSWKVNELIAKADNMQKSTEDSPVRVVVSFARNIDKPPISDLTFIDNIRTATGQPLPYASLMYIWENRAPKNSVIPNLHTSRVKMIVAESGGDKLGDWQEVTRNVYEDFKRAFGEEPGAISSIGIMTDTDNTGGDASAFYGDITFRRVPPAGR